MLPEPALPLMIEPPWRPGHGTILTNASSKPQRRLGPGDRRTGQLAVPLMAEPPWRPGLGTALTNASSKHQRDAGARRQKDGTHGSCQEAPRPDVNLCRGWATGNRKRVGEAHDRYPKPFMYPLPASTDRDEHACNLCRPCQRPLTALSARVFCAGVRIWEHASECRSERDRTHRPLS